MTESSFEVERWGGLKVWLFSLFHRTPESNLVLVDHAGLGADDRFLDVGCGLGAALEHAALTGADVFGVDPSPGMVEKASRRVPQAEVKEGSAESIPFPDDRFTIAFNASSYHHWTDPEAGLTEVLRVLAPGGRLLIGERKLKRGSGHGLDEGKAEEVAQTLLELGYATSAVDTVKVGRHDFVVVSGVAPG